MTTCIKCHRPLEKWKLVSDKLKRYCASCVIEAVKKLPNPDCGYCLGDGEYLTHSSDCDDDLCILSAGYHDCKGQMMDCNCSILDVSVEFNEDMDVKYE